MPIFPTGKITEVSCLERVSTLHPVPRRADTPFFIAEAQIQVLQILAKEQDPSRLTQSLPEILGMVRERMSALSNRKISIEQLLITQTLSRELMEYKVPSPAARATYRLQAVRKNIRWDKGFSLFILEQSKVCVGFARTLPPHLD